MPCVWGSAQFVCTETKKWEVGRIGGSTQAGEWRETSVWWSEKAPGPSDLDV